MEAIAEIVLLEGTRHVADTFASEVLKGLSRHPKALPCRYLYDQIGCELFRQITETVEYYPTRCELEILQDHCEEIRQVVGNDALRLVELGAGDGQKAELLLNYFLHQGLDLQFVPIDICGETVSELIESFKTKFAALGLRLYGLVGDYSDGLNWLKQQTDMPNLVLFFGSSIGNFHHRQMRRFLRRLRSSLKPGDFFLVGFDLKKEIPVLQRAYDDAAGVTRRFNLNLLSRINRELGGDFDLTAFYHHGYYHAGLGRMESWLISTVPQLVHICQLERSFALQAWEGIHVENSYKYDLAEIEEAAAIAGFRVRRHLFDSRQCFVDSLWQLES